MASSPEADKSLNTIKHELKEVRSKMGQQNGKIYLLTAQLEKRDDQIETAKGKIQKLEEELHSKQTNIQSLYKEIEHHQQHRKVSDGKLNLLAHQLEKAKLTAENQIPKDPAKSPVAKQLSHWNDIDSTWQIAWLKHFHKSQAIFGELQRQEEEQKEVAKRVMVDISTFMTPPKLPAPVSSPEHISVATSPISFFATPTKSLTTPTKPLKDANHSNHHSSKDVRSNVRPVSEDPTTPLLHAQQPRSEETRDEVAMAVYRRIFTGTTTEVVGEVEREAESLEDGGTLLDVTFASPFTTRHMLVSSPLPSPSPAPLPVTPSLLSQHTLCTTLPHTNTNNTHGNTNGNDGNDGTGLDLTNYPLLDSPLFSSPPPKQPPATSTTTTTSTSNTTFLSPNSFRAHLVKIRQENDQMKSDLSSFQHRLQDMKAQYAHYGHTNSNTNTNTNGSGVSKGVIDGPVAAGNVIAMRQPLQDISNTNTNTNNNTIHSNNNANTANSHNNISNNSNNNNNNNTNNVSSSYGYPKYTTSAANTNTNTNNTIKININAANNIHNINNSNNNSNNNSISYLSQQPSYHTNSHNYHNNHNNNTLLNKLLNNTTNTTNTNPNPNPHTNNNTQYSTQYTAGYIKPPLHSTYPPNNTTNTNTNTNYTNNINSTATYHNSSYGTYGTASITRKLF